MCRNGWNTYLLWFAHDLVNFRIPEINSLLSLLSIEMKWTDDPGDHPFWVVKMRSDECAEKLASRSIALRGIIHLWAHSDCGNELHRQLKSLPQSHFEPFFQPHISFKLEVETFSNHLSMQEQLAKIESFGYLPVRGPVNLKNPDVKLWYMEYYGLNPNTVPDAPYSYFFGRWICKGQRDLIQKFSLKTRKFIGNTSMDAQLSLFMANQAMARNGDVIYDPFVGTGSLLVPAAYFGAYVLGTDIDYLMLHGRTRPSRIQQKVRESDESVLSNLLQYGIQDRYLDILVADASRLLWRTEFELDAIITDPPYGIREPTERIGSHKNPQISEEQAATHIPSKIDYAHDHLYQDLLMFAANHLKIGGRLVTFVPISREDYSEETLPRHPSLRLVANSEQTLSALISRRLLTYEKISKEAEEELSLGDETKCSLAFENFRHRYFNQHEESRKERRLKKAASALPQNGQAGLQKKCEIQSHSPNSDNEIVQ